MEIMCFRPKYKIANKGTRARVQPREASIKYWVSSSTAGRKPRLKVSTNFVFEISSREFPVTVSPSVRKGKKRTSYIGNTT
jgi:hypothetical protein